MNVKQKQTGIVKYLLPHMGEMLFIAVFIAIIGLGPRLMNVDGDLGRHLTLGNYIIDTGHIPTSDVFSFTKYGDPLTPHEWLSDVLFALSFRLTGLNGVVWLTALTLSGSVFLIYLYSLKIGGLRLLAVFFAILAAAASSLHWLTRPHIFTIFFATVWTIEMDRLYRGKKKNWYIFPVLMLIWVNLHGAFLAGILIWLCFFAGQFFSQDFSWESTKLFLWAGVTSLLVSFINPAGFGIWKTGYDFLSNQYLVGHTAEYLPPNFQESSTWPFLILLLILIISFALNRRKLAMAHLFLVGGWALLALYSARNIPIFAAVSTPFLSKMVVTQIQKSQDNQLAGKYLQFEMKINELELKIRGGFWSVLTIVLVLLLLISGANLDFDQTGNGFMPETFPVFAVDWMEKNPLDGNGFNYFPWGGYLLYRIWPENLVFIDGQTDFYGEALTREYEQVITMSAEWHDVLDKYQVSWVLMPVESDLARLLTDDRDWKLVYSDQTAAIFDRKQ